MTYHPSNTQQVSVENSSDVGVYECEVKLKFRLIEENLEDCDREQLLRLVMDAFSYGSDEYLESLQAEVDVHEVAELEASPDMRRQLIRLRNATGLK
jgi:hypothetical protein